MKRMGVWLAVLFLLSGCSREPKEIRQGMALRSRLLQSQQCSFDADITADYGDEIYSFSMKCSFDEAGDMTFTVTAPESISGISGEVSDDGGALTFDDTVLHFELLTDDQLSPVSAPWIFMRTLRSGYLTSAAQENGSIRLTIDDSYDEDALTLDIWLDQDQIPVRGEILYDGRRILSLDVTSFEIM